MEYMEGGAVPVDGKRDTERFRLVFDMINQKESEIKCVSYSSLNGFIFSVGGEDVTASFKSITKGVGRDEQTGLEKILMKLVVISDKKEKLDNIEISGDGKILKLNDTVICEEVEEGIVENEGKGKPQIKVKQSIIESEFEKETKAQIDIFRKTWAFGKLPLCPSVLSYAVIDNVRSRIFMDMLLDKVGHVESIENSILRYLNKQLKGSGRRIGILCMEYKEKFQTYAEYAESKSQNEIENRETNARYILAKMIILLLECGIVHCDLHMNNVLIKPDCYETERTTGGNLDKICYEMIDFGRTVVKHAGLEIRKEISPSKRVTSVVTYPTKPTYECTRSRTNNTQPANKKNDGCVAYDKIESNIFGFLETIYNTDLAYKKSINNKLEFPQCAWIFKYAGLLTGKTLESNDKAITAINDIIIKYYDSGWIEGLDKDIVEKDKNDTRKLFDKIFEFKSWYKKEVFTSNESEVDSVFTFYGMMLTYYLQKFGQGYKIEQINSSEENGPIFVEISRDSGVGDGGDIKVINSQMANLNTIIREMGGSIHFSFVGK
jgi:hypothetical protein